MTDRFLKALNQSRPRLIVHQHAGYSGVGEYMLDRWFRPLACRFKQSQDERECRVVLTTTLREPVARIFSHALWANAYGLHPERDSHSTFAAFARQFSNFQTKYQLFGSDWRTHELTTGNVTYESKLIEPALECLSYFDLVGRTEELDAFRDSVDERMGWPLLNQSVSELHNATQARRTFPTPDVWALARRYNTIDAQLYRSFCHRKADASPRRRTRALCESGARYRFPHFWTSVRNEKCGEHFESCDWKLVRDAACRGGNADVRPFRETHIVCEDLRDGREPSSTLQPYRRRSQPEEPFVFHRTNDEGRYEMW